MKGPHGANKKCFPVPLTSVHAAARPGGLYCGRCAITHLAFELFTDERDNAGSGDWVRFAKNEESLKAHLRIGNGSTRTFRQRTPWPTPMLKEASFRKRLETIEGLLNHR